MAITAQTSLFHGVNLQSPRRAPVAPLFGLFRGARKNPLQFFVTLAARYDVVEFPNPYGKFFLVNDPNLIGHILQENYLNYPKSDYYQRVRPIFGEGLFELEGDKWKRKRQTVQPAFHRQNIEGLVGLMTEEIAFLLKDWESLAAQRESIDICPPLMHMTFRVITRALCSSDIPGGMSELTRALTIIMREGERVLWSLMPLVQSLPSPRRWRLKQALRSFDEVMYALIERRLESGRSHGDLLDLLLAQTDPETGEPVHPRVLRDDLMTMLIAGHETTAMGIAWTCALMSKNPFVLCKLATEIDNVLGNRLPTIADLPALKYTGMVIDEALRLYPPFWTISRRCRENDTLGQYHIPAGSTLMLCPYVTHRNPRFWPNPEGFDPDRFAPEISRKRPKYAYFPFGGGPRVCVGKSLALMEAKIYLAMLVQKYRLDLVPGQTLSAETMISLRPRDGLEMLIRPTA